MYQDFQQENQGLTGGPQKNAGGLPSMGAIPTGKLFNGVPKKTIVKYLWIGNTALIFPYFVSASACSGGQFPGGLVFTFLFITFAASALSVFGYFLMLKPAYQNEMNYGAFLASLFFMSTWMLNSAVDAGSFNNEFYMTLGINVPAVRSVIAFSTFLFMGYLAALVMFFRWKDDLGFCGTANGGAPDAAYSGNPAFSEGNSQQPSVPDASSPDYSNVEL